MEQMWERIVGIVVRSPLAMALACLASCGCPEERCGPTPQLLLTVRNGDSLVPEALATVLPGGEAFVSNGCARAGADWGCTHELLTIPGHDDLRVDDAGAGRGGWQPNVDIPVRIRVETDAAQALEEFDISVHVNECGHIETPNVVVDFAAADPTVTVERGPHGCERP